MLLCCACVVTLRCCCVDVWPFVSDWVVLLCCVLCECVCFVLVFGGSCDVCVLLSEFPCSVYVCYVVVIVGLAALGSVWLGVCSVPVCVTRFCVFEF